MDEQCSHFFAFYRERIRYVEEYLLESELIEGLILMCCYLDALSGYRYGGSSSYERFRRFLMEHSEVPEIWSRVDLPGLNQSITDEEHVLREELCAALRGLGMQTFGFHDLDYDVDVSYEVLAEKLSETLNATQVESLEKDLRRFEYVSILWREYRNNSVHETSSKKKKAFNLSDKSVPFHSVISVPIGEGQRQEYVWFHIPHVFILETLKNAVDSFSRKVEAGECTIQGL